ncbi:bifunctional protein-serine/threonine kinase/phosphatase [Alteromonas aestuariivivens]|uniref:Bifunctional protein-serine/threonine kinase/phosphatase n=1 Tax=Alteromonas aestuariivivens TaxID=1938339 RepID=A0A3D8MC10_9ALTE|nr:bifunctional protein-serine/threonine kinase/phosphatase [Alteromonas aestuariivivens]RDV28016.1 bifunctional protein-serine/threonine kinase/phosphatase [Alteromonas aestuariivivens]
MLSLSIGQFSSAGEKSENQDCYGAVLPAGSSLFTKGAVAAVADGISSSSVSAIASQTAVKSFLEDYYCTSDAWTVGHAARQVLNAINSWLCAQTRQGPWQGETEKGYVCTFSAVVFRHCRAYLFHAGDTRIYRVRKMGSTPTLEQLTRDHRVWGSGQQSYLGNALGMSESLQLDEIQLPLVEGDYFILASDGVYDFVSPSALRDITAKGEEELSRLAQSLVQQAFDNGSTDNLTVQIIRVDKLPETGFDVLGGAEELPIPAVMSPGDELDGYRVQKVLYSSARSHVYRVEDIASGHTLALKAPSIEMGDSDHHLEQLLMEEWIARRIHSAHVVSAPKGERPRTALYTLSECLQGVTLGQWLNDNPSPSLDRIRDIIEQVARGLMALHRSDILHQDIRPENLMIDEHGLVKIIDLGAARIGGVSEWQPDSNGGIPGTAIYAAPEYFVGAGGSSQSDLYSLAVLAYYLLSGEYPYGTQVARCHTLAAQRKLRYRTVLDPKRNIPFWVDDTLRKATHINPLKRYEELSEFVYDLRHPNPKYVNRQRPPLLERNPVRFWQGVSGVLLLVICVLIIDRAGGVL